MIGLWLWGCAGGPALQIAAVAPDPDTSGPGAAAGSGCGSTCSAPTPAEVAGLDDLQIRDLLQQVAAAEVGAPTLAVETLLFHADDTIRFLADHGADPLSADREAWLRRELKRDRVAIGLRLVDDAGRILGQRDDVVPLKDKQHLLLYDTGSLGRLDVNGKVKRVGVKHLWARF